MTTRHVYRDSNGRFSSAPLSLDVIHGAKQTSFLLKGLHSHVKDLEGLYKKSNQYLARRTYSALRADLEAVIDCFESLRREHGFVDGQLSLPFASGGDTRDIGRTYLSCGDEITSVIFERRG
jgi:hypothetical protein